MHDNLDKVTIKPRVLVWGFSDNRAGTEAVIHSIASRLPDFSFDFLCYSAPVSYADLFDEGGANENRYYVLPIKIKHPFSYWRRLHQFVEEHAGEYCALWCNINDMSNIDIVKMASRLEIERIAVHAHNSAIPNLLVTKIFHGINSARCRQLSTSRFACSSAAGSFFFADLSFNVIPNMVDRDNFSFCRADREAVRSMHGIGEHDFVIGFVGRLEEQKNPKYLIELMPELLAGNPHVKLMLVGEGSMRAELKQMVITSHLEDSVLFAGVQREIPKYLSAFDAFAFPSIFEGFGNALVEAQFNGLPAVISENIPSDAVISSATKVAPLNDKKEWSRLLLSANRSNVLIDENRAARFDSANFDSEIRPIVSEAFISADGSH